MPASYYLPPEWVPQHAILLGWPIASTDWSKQMPAVEKVYLQLMALITPYQQVLLIAPLDQHDYVRQRLQEANLPLARISIINAPYNDTWMRDTGPITVWNEHNQPVFIDFEFNGWGEKHPFAEDNLMTRHLIQDAQFKNLYQLDHAQSLKPGFILEGGSIEVNGAGLLLTSKQCLLNPNRANSHRSARTQSEMTELLKQTLGVQEVLWISQGHVEGDDTDSHIDTLARFSAEKQVCYQSCDEPTYPGFAGLKALEQELQAIMKPRDIELIALPWPDACYSPEGPRMAATYVNFLIMNQQVIVPQYDVPQDAQAIATLQKCFPDRKVVGINCRPLIRQGGSLHCITMQLPASQA
jgi:agmatine deiminase